MATSNLKILARYTDSLSHLFIEHAVIERDGPDAEAWLKLPPDTVGTHLDSSLQSIAAEALYRVRYNVMHASDWLKMLVNPI